MLGHFRDVWVVDINAFCFLRFWSMPLGHQTKDQHVALMLVLLFMLDSYVCCQSQYGGSHIRVHLDWLAATAAASSTCVTACLQHLENLVRLLRRGRDKVLCEVHTELGQPSQVLRVGDIGSPLGLQLSLRELSVVPQPLLVLALAALQQLLMLRSFKKQPVRLARLLLCTLGTAAAGIALKLSVLHLLLHGLLLLLELQLSACLDCGIAQALQLVAGLVAAIHHLADLEADGLCALAQHRERVEVAQLRSALNELLVRMVGAEVHEVREQRIDEVADWVVGRVQHELEVLQLEEDHDLDGERGIVRCAYTLAVDVELIGDGAQLREHERSGHLCVLVAALGSMPAEHMKPLVDVWDEYCWAMHNVALDGTLRVLGIHHDDLKRVDRDGVHDGDRLVQHGVLEQRERPALVLLETVAVPDLEVLVRVCDVAVHEAHAREEQPLALGARDGPVLAAQVPYTTTLAILDCALSDPHHFGVARVAELEAHVVTVVVGCTRSAGWAEPEGCVACLVSCGGLEDVQDLCL
mmetsp:Transcript_75316/g.166407  ORF Transcript_75316/g.166407 Transcript_75316/m.166407 type:complete len:525 (+) Transcript_75316:84-1658(+)